MPDAKTSLTYAKTFLGADCGSNVYQIALYAICKFYPTFKNSQEKRSYKAAKSYAS